MNELMDWHYSERLVTVYFGPTQEIQYQMIVIEK